MIMKSLSFTSLMLLFSLSIVAQDYGSLTKEPFARGLYKVRSGEFYGIYDERDNVVVSVEYNDILFPKDSIALLRKSDGCVYGTITMSGEVSLFPKPFKFNPDYPFYSEGLLPVQSVKVFSEDKWFYIDSKGKTLDKVGKVLVMSQNYRRTMPFNEGYASVLNMRGESLHVDREGNKRFVIDDERVVFRATVSHGEVVIITENGIKLYQEDKNSGSYKAIVKRVISPSYNWKVANGDKGTILQFVDGSLYLDYLGRAVEFVPIAGPVIRFIEQEETPEEPEEVQEKSESITLTHIPQNDFSIEKLSVSLRYTTVTANSKGYATVSVQITNNAEADSCPLTVRLSSDGITPNESNVKMAAGETKSFKLAVPAKFSDAQRTCVLSVTIEDGEHSTTKKFDVKLKRFDAGQIL